LRSFLSTLPLLGGSNGFLPELAKKIRATARKDLNSYAVFAEKIKKGQKVHFLFV
jgi:hypothetical protein